MDPKIGIPSYPDGRFNFAFVDPPYGIDYQSSRRIDSKRFKKIKNDETPFIDWIDPLYKKMTDGGRLICFYRFDVQDQFLNAIKEAGFQIKGQGIWDKVIHGMGDINGSIAPQHELFIYATKGRYEFTNKRPKSVYKVTRVNAADMIHPNEKPVNLYRMFLRDFCNPGDVGIDLFVGSASSLTTYEQEGFEYVGYELDEEYYNAATKRMKQVLSQTRLF